MAAIQISRSLNKSLHIFSALICCSKTRGLLRAWKRVPKPTPRGVSIIPLPRGDMLGLDLVNSKLSLSLKGGERLIISGFIF